MAKRKLTAVDQRIAAASHKLQIVRVRVADGLAVNVQMAIAGHVERAKAICAREVKRAGAWTQARQREVKARLAEAFQAGMNAGQKEFGAVQRAMAEMSHDGTVTMLVRSIPRSWFAIQYPEILLLGRGKEWRQEATASIQPDRLTIARKAFGKYVAPALDVAAYAEPVARIEMSDEEWEEYAGNVIFPSPTRSQIETWVNDPQWLTTFPGNESKFNDPAFHDRLVSAMADGDGIDQVTRQIRDLENGVYYKARRTARTECGRVAEMAQRETWEHLGGMLAGAQILAILDQNTRTHHAERNGTVYLVEPRDGEPGMDELPVVPDEPNCRCWTAPIMTTPEEYRDDPAMRAMFENGAGDNIPDPTAYDKWFEQADEQDQKLAVGSGRWNAMDDMLGGVRKPEWTDFVDPSTGRLMTRNDLRAESEADRAARKAEVEKVIREREALISQIAAKGFLDPK